MNRLLGFGVILAASLTLPSPSHSESGRSLSANDGIALASCGPGSLPETGLQGQVPLVDRLSGRSKLGYRCNLELVGQYQGQGTSWVNASYGRCGYLSTSFYGLPRNPSPGVQVVDASDPAKPRFSRALVSTSMYLGTWETLKVNKKRGLLAGAAAGPGIGGAFFDVYDIATDCTRPRLLNRLVGNLPVPSNLLAHEGEFSPDGRTFWTSSLAGGIITAIDISNPALPRIAAVGSSGLTNHGFKFSADGNRMYMTSTVPAGVVILDVSDVQKRKLFPSMRYVGSIFWTDGIASQHTLPVSYGGHPYLIVVDELGFGGVRLLDIGDERNPRVVANYRLQIQQSAHQATALADIGVIANGLFGYDAHYCSVDRDADPTALACSYFNSGVRVFDIRNPGQPREIAYFNPPAQTGKIAQLPGSEHGNLIGLGANMTADWCSSPPTFVGRDQLWVSCQDNGFMVLKFTNAAYAAPGA